MERLAPRGQEAKAPGEIPSLKAQRRMQPYVHSSYLERPHDELKDHFHFSLKVVGKRRGRAYDVVHQNRILEGWTWPISWGQGRGRSGHACHTRGTEDRDTGRMCEDGLWVLTSPTSTGFCSVSAVPISSCPLALLS